MRVCVEQPRQLPTVDNAEPFLFEDASLRRLRTQSEIGATNMFFDGASCVSIDVPPCWTARQGLRGNAGRPVPLSLAQLTKLSRLP